MWICSHCGERLEEQFDSCWRCAAPRGPTASTEQPPKKARRVRYEMHRGTWTSWEDLFAKASEFASEIGPERLIGISHSADQSEGIVVVWYWADELVDG